MQRRTVLAFVGATAIAGCLDESPSSDPGNGSDTTDDDDDGVGNDEDGTPDPTLEIEDGTLEGPQDRTTALLTNEGDDTLWFNNYDWTLEKRVDETWERIAPWDTPVPERSLEPGESYRRTITVDHDATNHEALGPGTYRFSLAGVSDEFEVTGPELELSADDIDERTDEDGTPVAITKQALESAEADHTDPDRLRFDRTGEDHDDPLIPERAVQSHPLRNALPTMLEGDLEELVLYAGSHTGDETLFTVLDGAQPPASFGYEGERFVMYGDNYDGELE